MTLDIKIIVVCARGLRASRLLAIPERTGGEAPRRKQLAPIHAGRTDAGDVCSFARHRSTRPGETPGYGRGGAHRGECYTRVTIVTRACVCRLVPTYAQHMPGKRARRRRICHGGTSPWIMGRAPRERHCQQMRWQPIHTRAMSIQESRWGDTSRQTARGERMAKCISD